MGTGPDTSANIADPARFVGREIGGVKLTRLLGAGGMGAVFAGDHLRLGKPVAVKILPKGLAREAERAERFLREARAAAKLEHPAIVTVYDVGEVADAWFITMRLVDGESSAARVRRAGPLGPHETLRVVRAVAEALDVAHRRGIIHRDVKPENVLYGPEDEVLLADFGLVRDLEASTQLSGSGQILGTPAYMSPEQARGDRVDARSDLYSLGTTAYYLGTGLPPFQAETAIATALKHIMDEAAPPSEVQPGLPPAFDDFVAWCMAKQPDDRPASAAAVVAEVDRLLGGGLRAPPRRRRPRPLAKGVLIGAGAGLVVLLGLVALRAAFGGRAGERGGGGTAPRESPRVQPPLDAAKVTGELAALIAARDFEKVQALADRVLAHPRADATARAAAERARAEAGRALATARREQALRDAVAEFRAALKGEAPVPDAVRRLAPAGTSATELEHAEALATLARSAIVWAGDPDIGPLAEREGRWRATVTLPLRRIYGPDPEAVQEWPVEFVADGERFYPKLGRPDAVAKISAVLWLDRMFDAQRRRNDEFIRAELSRAVAARGQPPGSPTHEVALRKLVAQAKVALFVGGMASGLRYEVEHVAWDDAERVAECAMRFERDPTRRDPDGEGSVTTLALALRSGTWVWWGGDREPRRPGRPLAPGKRDR